MTTYSHIGGYRHLEHSQVTPKRRYPRDITEFSEIATEPEIAPGNSGIYLPMTLQEMKDNIRTDIGLFRDCLRKKVS